MRRIPGVEIGKATDMGIPVAAEAENSNAAQALGEQLQNLKGVKSAVLVYHNFEDVTEEVAPGAGQATRLSSAGSKG